MTPDLGMGAYGHELSYAVGGPRPINLVLNKNGKPTNHLSNPLPNANNTMQQMQLQMNNLAIHQQATLENKTTLQKVQVWKNVIIDVGVCWYTESYRFGYLPKYMNVIERE